jgi:hypothetical protein
VSTATAEQPTKSTIKVSPAMLAAGKVAFLRRRSTLSDLHDYFDQDLTKFLSEIYRSMAAEA